MRQFRLKRYSKYHSYWKKARKAIIRKYKHNKKRLLVFSKENLKNPTIAEINFEHILKTLNITYYKQASFCKYGCSYIVDFLLEHPFYLIIEVDGEYHKASKQVDYDLKRDIFFAKIGYKTLRINNKDVFENPVSTKNRLKQVVESQKKLHKFYKRREYGFVGGALEEIKPTKPANVAQDSSILVKNPSL